ncbi:hypothetical protein MTO96_016399 [Rhipicephalus appendiculatus]
MPKPRRRGSSPPVLCTDSPRTIAYRYEHGLGDAAEKSGHYFASPGTVQGAIKGVPVFIQSKRSDGALLRLDPVDLFVAVSMISGVAPSQYRITPTGCLLVDMPSVEGVNRLLQSDHLCGVAVKVSIPDAYQKSSSVIRAVPTSYSEEELLDTLRPQGVINVKRIVRYTVPDTAGEGGVAQTPTGKVVLTFPRSLERPAEVEIGAVKYKLREFVDRPARCYKCQRLGHVSRHCASRLRCKRCCGPARHQGVSARPTAPLRQLRWTALPELQGLSRVRANAQKCPKLSQCYVVTASHSDVCRVCHWSLRHTLGLRGDDANVPDAVDAYDSAEPTFSDDAKLRRDVESLDELALKLEDLAATLRDALQRASAQSPSLADRRAQGAHYIVRFQLPIVAFVQFLWVGMLATFDYVVTDKTSPGYRYLVHAIMVALQVVNVLHVGLASLEQDQQKNHQLSDTEVRTERLFDPVGIDILSTRYTRLTLTPPETVLTFELAAVWALVSCFLCVSADAVASGRRRLFFFGSVAQQASVQSMVACGDEPERNKNSPAALIVGMGNLSGASALASPLVSLTFGIRFYHSLQWVLES